MEAKSNYTLIGVIVVLLTVGLITAGLWLSVGFNKKKYTVYAVYFHEAISGLSAESAVKYNGVQVGQVLKINLSHSDPREVQILLNIEAGTPVTTSTYATLISQGITGTSIIGLSASSSDMTPLKKIPNEPYPIIPTRPSLFKQLDSVLKDVSENVDNVSIKLKEIFTNENIENVKKSLINLQTFTDVIAKNNDIIARELQNSDILLKNMATASKDLPEIINNLKVNMNKLSNDLAKAGGQVTKTMQAGRQTLDTINQQALPPAVTLLRRLNTIAANLEEVSSQIRQNPSVVIRGSISAKPGPGEKP